MLNFPYLEDTTMQNDLWAWCASSFHIKILEWRIHKMATDEHKEISRLNVSDVDDLNVTWNVLKR